MIEVVGTQGHCKMQDLAHISSKFMAEIKRQRFFQLSCLVISILSVFVFVVPETPSIESPLRLDQIATGDFYDMIERQQIRVLVPFSRTFYFLDKADQRGLTYDFLKEFEKYVNEKLKKRTLPIKLVVIPTSRDRLLPALVEGYGDIAAGNLTITPERKQIVDFSAPFFTNVDEIIVSGPTALQIIFVTVRMS